MILKLGRRDLTLPKSWRPISLLSCLGKGLERLIGRWIAYIAIRSCVLSPTQFGALPKRSGTDLTAALLHDIEDALTDGATCTLVTADIKGAFDVVLRQRLVLRVCKQGWLEHLVRWIASFMENRSAAVRLNDFTLPASPLQCGLPQGLPALLVLFLLYTEPIYKLPLMHRKFGYADDVATLIVVKDLKTSTRHATQALTDLEAWGVANGVSFGPNKTEVMHFY